MTIKRVLDGKEYEIELTDHELWMAFDEYEHLGDIETIDLFCADDDGNCIVPDDKIDEVANRYRSAYDDYLDACSDARCDIANEAMREVLGDLDV